MEYVKVHGLQRSGTNYLAKLINDNFKNTRALVNAGGWKHGPYCAPWALGREVHVVTVAKNPYAWLVSLYNYWRPHLGDATFADFVEKTAVFHEPDGAPYKLRARTPVEHWNNMNFHWLSIRLNEKRSVAVPYESLVLDGGGVLRAVAAYFGLEASGPDFADCQQVCTPGEESPGTSGEPWLQRDYYVREHYLSWFPPPLLRTVNDQLDKEVLTLLGYKLVT